MNEDLKELQKQECNKRLDILQKTYGLLENVIKEFDKEGVIYYSEYRNKIAPATLYWLSNEKDYTEAVEDFEEKYNSKVYHAILTPTIFGRNLTLLYVSQYTDEWKEDRTELAEGLPLAYCINLDAPECSEFGGVQIDGNMGGIVRLA